MLDTEKTEVSEETIEEEATVKEAVVFEIPDEIKSQGADAVDKYERAIRDYVALGGGNYKERMEIKKERERLNSVTTQKEVTPTKVSNKEKSFNDFLSEITGEEVKTGSQRYNIQDEDPDAYAKAEDLYTEYKLNKLSQKTTVETTQKISNDLYIKSLRQKGIDPDELEAFMILNGFSSMQSAEKFYQPTIKKVGKAEKINKAAETRAKVVKTVESSGNEYLGDLSKKPLSKMTLAEVNALPDDDPRFTKELEEKYGKYKK